MFIALNRKGESTGSEKKTFSLDFLNPKNCYNVVFVINYIFLNPFISVNIFIDGFGIFLMFVVLL